MQIRCVWSIACTLSCIIVRYDFAINLSFFHVMPIGSVYLVSPVAVLENISFETHSKTHTADLIHMVHFWATQELFHCGLIFQIFFQSFSCFVGGEIDAHMSRLTETVISDSVLVFLSNQCNFPFWSMCLIKWIVLKESCWLYPKDASVQYSNNFHQFFSFFFNPESWVNLVGGLLVFVLG